MEFKTLGTKERKLLLTALDMNPDELICTECKAKVSYKDCGIMPKYPSWGEDDDDAVILCKSPLCMCIFLEKMDDTEEHKLELEVKKIREEIQKEVAPLKKRIAEIDIEFDEALKEARRKL